MATFDIVCLVIMGLCTLMNINTFYAAVNGKRWWLYVGAFIAQACIFYGAAGIIREYYPHFFG
jgi:hypothetical protein